MKVSFASRGFALGYAVMMFLMSSLASYALFASVSRITENVRYERAYRSAISASMLLCDCAASVSEDSNIIGILCVQISNVNGGMMTMTIDDDGGLPPAVCTLYSGEGSDVSAVVRCEMFAFMIRLHATETADGVVWRREDAEIVRYTE